MATILSGCTSKPDKLSPIQFTSTPLPALPGDLARVIPDPGVREGRDARIELARNREWGKALARQHSSYVAWYRKVRNVQK